MNSSERLLELRFIDVGKRLTFPPYYVDELICLLDELLYHLSKIRSFPSRSMQDALWLSKHACIAPKLLRHLNAAVRVTVALCINEINVRLDQSETRVQQLDLKLNEKKCLTQHISPYVLGCYDFKLQSNSEKATIDEPKPMEQEGDLFHELVPAVGGLNLSIEVVTEVDNLCVEPLLVVDYSCAANAISLETQEELNESMAQEIVLVSEEFEEVTKDLGVDLTLIANNLGVEEIVVEEFHPQKANLSKCGVCPSNLLKIRIIDFLGVDSFKLHCDSHLTTFFDKLRSICKVSHFEAAIFHQVLK